jgi:glucose-6-phosphate dehydrogenase assembly protein OpcA
VGQIASRRLIDSALQVNSREFLKEFAGNYQPGDGDLAWTRITLWRAQLAALFEQHSHRLVKSVRVLGSASSPSADLLAMWLGTSLQIEAELVSVVDGAQIQGIYGVEVEFEDGFLHVHRPDQVATIKQTGAPDSSVLLPRRSDQDCLVEDMRFLGEDEIFGSVLRGFLAK